MTAPKKHYFVINQLGQSADRRGPFESREAAEAWAEKYYAHPAWVFAVEPVGHGKGYTTLDKDGNRSSGN